LEPGKKIKIEKFRAGEFTKNFQDIIPIELLLTIFLNKIAVSTISCSPGNLIELAAGYLINNGYINNYSDIDLIRLCSNELNDAINKNILGGRIDVSSKSAGKNFKKNNQIKYISPSCGTIDEFVLNGPLVKINSSIKITSGTILKLNSETLNYQKFKKEFGGLHSGTLFDNEGRFLAIFEDIGRHNCIDKIAGYALMNNINLLDKIIFTTGRLSLDVILKVCKMSVPVIVTNSSITYSAVNLAKKLNLTAIGYARSGRFNIYSCPSRIIK
jgi:FdhD protein